MYILIKIKSSKRYIRIWLEINSFGFVHYSIDLSYTCAVFAFSEKARFLSIPIVVFLIPCSTMHFSSLFGLQMVLLVGMSWVLLIMTLTLWTTPIIFLVNFLIKGKCWQLNPDIYWSNDFCIIPSKRCRFLCMVHWLGNCSFWFSIYQNFHSRIGFLLTLDWIQAFRKALLFIPP